ncbi:NAD(P)-dependent oxidoreductase [Paenibacillus thalictri]|uniref:NAD(P)-dependent oxidoreductase n=1 Tax=Paenibacillus thalictri TaxID=2527873 RepID=A0A4Q9DTI8_9BACL|nr:NAD(P)-dependent oxidoreductase [Paenibacillus thalictri]TBL79455.1 NAD(P)-dependent oxidoreductase [Paenibacillus thalictri]
MELRRIGFIGLGAMGLPMARNLLKSGFELHIAAHHRREPVEELKRAGAIEHASVPEVAAQCDALITILPEDRQVRQVLLSDGVLERLRPDGMLIEMTSGSPDMMKQVAGACRRRGMRVLDAPVSGGTAGAENGTLTVMAGGDETAFEAARPVLEAMAKQMYLVGEAGTGKAVKAINQMLAGVHMIAAAEAAALAEQLGIGKDTVKQVIANSSGASWMLLNKLDALADRSFHPGFKLKLMRKDVQIAVSEGRDLPLPLASLALQLYKISEKELGELDFSAVGRNMLS